MRIDIVTRAKVRELLEQGSNVAEIARELGITKSTVCYHKRRLGFHVDARFARRYDWGQIQAFYDEGHSLSECQARFGFSRETWHSAIKRGDLVTRPWTAVPLHTVLVRNSHYKRSQLKSRLIASGLKENRCELCGIDQWQGKPLTIALHHRNGDRYDNRIENLEFLCPNCHSQTPNYSGRNNRRDRERPVLRVRARRLPLLGTVS